MPEPTDNEAAPPPATDSSDVPAVETLSVDAADASAAAAPPATKKGGRTRLSRDTTSVPKFQRKKAVIDNTERRQAVVKDTGVDAKKAAKEAKAARMAKFDARHKFILGRVGDLLGLSQEDAEEVMAERDDPRIFAIFEEYFKPDGAKILLFYGNTKTVKEKDGEKQVPTFTLADPSKDPLPERVVYCIRITTRGVTTSNIAAECNFGLLAVPAGQRGGFLASVADVISNVMSPVLQANTNWGKMKAGAGQQEEFYDSLDSFRMSLNEAHTAVGASVSLDTYDQSAPDAINLDTVSTPEDFSAVVEDRPKAVETLEAIAAVWCEQPGLASKRLNLLDNIHALRHITKYDVLSIKPISLDGTQEKLRAVGIGARVGHGEHTGTSVRQLKVFVFKLLGAVDTLATRAVVVSEITTLAHKARNDTVERAALVTKALFAGAQSPEVFCSSRHHIRPQRHLNRANILNVRETAHTMEEGKSRVYVCVCACVCVCVYARAHAFVCCV